MELQVISARISAIIHATEDPEKVLLALNRAHGQEVPPSMLERRVVKGHFGNEISTLTLRLRGRLAESSLAYLWRKLSSLDRENLLRELDSRLDEASTLHVRLDKQECFRESLRLRDQDPVKLQISIRGSNETIELRQLLQSYTNDG